MCTDVQHNFHIKIMMFVSFNCYTMGATSGTGTAQLPYKSTLVFHVVCVAQSFVSCVVFSRSLFVLFLLARVILYVCLSLIYGLINSLVSSTFIWNSIHCNILLKKSNFKNFFQFDICDWKKQVCWITTKKIRSIWQWQ